MRPQVNPGREFPRKDPALMHPAAMALCLQLMRGNIGHVRTMA